MRDFTSKNIKTIKPSGIRKYYDIAKDIDDCLFLAVGEPDFITPRHIIDAGISSLNKGQTSYTTNLGLVELREEIARWNKRKYNLDYKKEEIIVTCGAAEAIDISIRGCIDPGDEVIVLDPSYVCYIPDIILGGGVVKTIKLKNENNFKLTPEQLKEAITPKTKILILNYPNNPTGAIMEKSDLEKIRQIIIDNDLLVITDEIYSELTYGVTHTSIASLPDMKERCLVINGFSKAYAMTGWRLGYVMGPENIINQIKKIHQFIIMCASITSQYAGIEALRNGDEDIIKMREEYDNRRKYLLSEFKRIGLPCFEPKGAFYIFPYIGNYHMSSEDFVLDLLQKEKVVAVPGSSFGEAGEGFIRISYAYSMDTLQKAIARIEKYLKSLNK